MKSKTYGVSFDNISKDFFSNKTQIRAIELVDLKITTGEFVCIVGPSGCGKSTLIKIGAGLLNPTSGDVRYLGEKINGPVSEVGIVFQNAALLDWRKTLPNVMLPIEMRGLDYSVYQPRAKELLRSVGLEDFMDRYPYELSGGMQQRTAICRALIHDPPVLLMDEPFGALDALTREQLSRELIKIWETKKQTVIFVTHSIPEAVFLGDRVVVMTPRPGNVAKIFDIKLPRPRDVSVERTSAFTDYVDSIRTILGPIAI